MSERGSKKEKERARRGGREERKRERTGGREKRGREGERTFSIHLKSGLLSFIHLKCKSQKRRYEAPEST